MTIRLAHLGRSLSLVGLLIVAPACQDADSSETTRPDGPSTVATAADNGSLVVATAVGTLPRPTPPPGLDRISRRVIGAMGEELAKDPTSTTAWTRYGNVCLMNLWGEEAIVAYRHALTRPDVDRPAVLWYLANALWKAERFQEAIEVAEESLRLDPDFTEGWVSLATWRLDLGELDAAEAALRNAPDGSVEPTRRATISTDLALQSGRSDEARDIVAGLVEVAPGPYASRLAVNIGRAVGDEDLARMHEENAAPSIGRFEDDRMAALAPLGRHEEADLRRAVLIREKLPPAEALPQVRKIIVQRPQLPMLRVIAADCLRDLGRHREAKAALDTVYETNPPDHEFWALDAIVHLNIASELRENPRLPDTVRQRAGNLMERALASSARAIEINPRIGYGWQFRALVLEAEGRWTEAAEAFRRAAEVAETEQQRVAWTSDAARCEAEAVAP